MIEIEDARYAVDGRSGDSVDLSDGVVQGNYIISEIQVAENVVDLYRFALKGTFYARKDIRIVFIHVFSRETDDLSGTKAQFEQPLPFGHGEFPVKVEHVKNHGHIRDRFYERIKGNQG